MRNRMIAAACVLALVTLTACQSDPDCLQKTGDGICVDNSQYDPTNVAE